LLIVLVACGGGSPPPLGERVGPLVGAALTAADHERAPWRCAAADGPQLPDDKLEPGGHAWKLAGHVVQRVEATNDVVIGVIADAGGAAPQTIAALGRLRAKIDAAQPTVVVTLGGMGASERELETTLAVLADKAAWPIIAIPGDLEPVAAHVEAIAVLRKRGVPIIDGRLARRIELGGATIATVPGAGSAARLPAGADGCGYRPADLAAIAQELRDAKGIRVLASFEAPRQRSGEPAGEIAVDQPYDIALSASVALGASRARTGARDGSRVALTPGASDATVRLPADRSTAGVLVVHEGSWTWKPLTDG
jgi:hypothetical protein